MPTDKDFKRLVRARMLKTGEAYTSARAHLLQRRPRRRPAAPTAAVAPPPPDHKEYARLAGMSDAAIKAKTGCTWKRWVDALDYLGAKDMPHRKIAELVHEKFRIDDWWSQTVAVGYERIRGLREIGQRRGGGYEATKSKTVAAPIGVLYRAFSDDRWRRKWLPVAKLTIRTATRDKSMRLDWGDGTRVQLQFTPKGDARSHVAVQHVKLPDQKARERMKGFWAERLGALAHLLSE